MPSTASVTGVRRFRVENWAPFVVGYFTRDASGPHIVAKQQLAPERAARLEAALAALPAPAAQTRTPIGQRPAPRADRDELLSGDLQLGSAAPHGTRREPEPASEAKAKTSSWMQAAPEQVLKQLSRGADQRERMKRKAQSVRRSDAQRDDPLSGLDGL